MSIVGHGVDIVECSRIARLLERHADRFFERMLTPAEQAQARRLRDAVPHIAGRFAAKEAILKVLGTGWRGPIAWTDMEIVNDVAGMPHVTLRGACADIAHQRGIERIIVSISHSEHYAVASAIGCAV